MLRLRRISKMKQTNSRYSRKYSNLRLGKNILSLHVFSFYFPIANSGFKKEEQCVRDFGDYDRSKYIYIVHTFFTGINIQNNSSTQCFYLITHNTYKFISIHMATSNFRLMLRVPGTVSILLACVGLLSAGIYGLTELEQKFDPTWFLPPSSDISKWFVGRFNLSETRLFLNDPLLF